MLQLQLVDEVYGLVIPQEQLLVLLEGFNFLSQYEGQDTVGGAE